MHMCDDNLYMCDDNLYMCDDNLDMCDDNLDMCDDNLDMCDDNLDNCRISLMTNSFSVTFPRHRHQVAPMKPLVQVQTFEIHLFNYC